MAKQTIIPEVDTGGTGADKINANFTELYNRAETDPIYLADKPDIALKSEVTALEATIATALNDKVDDSDPRLTDAREPLPHTHDPVDINAGLIEAGTNINVTRDAATGVYTIDSTATTGDGGTMDHADLDNLDYANSGHTGFVSSDDFDALEFVTTLPYDDQSIDVNINLIDDAIEAHNLSILSHENQLEPIREEINDINSRLSGMGAIDNQALEDHIEDDIRHLPTDLGAIGQVPTITDQGIKYKTPVQTMEYDAQDIDVNIIGGISDAPANDQLHGRINNEWQIIPSHSVDLMFFGVEVGRPIAGHAAPLTTQIIIPSGTHFPANPGIWHDITTFTIGRDLYGTELEFIPGNLFTAKMWLRSDMLRDKVQFRLSAIDIRSGTSLAVGTGEIDLGQTGELQPLIIPGFYEVPAVVPAEYIRMNLQALSPLFGIQIGLFSIPPSEISYISRLISGVTLQETALWVSMSEQIQALAAKIEALESHRWAKSWN